MTWNPTTGCNKISNGCKFCYAEIMSGRLRAMGVRKYQNGFELTLHPETLNIPYTWKKPKIVFVNSMSDLFHEKVPLDYIQKVFKVMKDNPQHIFQILTKRAENLYNLNYELEWTSNIWMGVSVENLKVVERIDFLRKTEAFTKFLSCEPLLGPLTNINLVDVDWVIVGGESGRKPRPMHQDWVIDIKNQCKEQSIPFFFKQWGGTNKKISGRTLDGNIYNEMPHKENLITD